MYPGRETTAGAQPLPELRRHFWIGGVTVIALIFSHRT